MPKVLVVDDEFLICELVVECFTGVDAEVHCAVNAAEGAKLLAAHIFDLAIIDVQLPGKSAIEFIEIATSQDVPILMMTGHPDTIEIFTNFSIPKIWKPFSMQKLLDDGLRIIVDRIENVRRAKESVAAMQAAKATGNPPI